MLLSTYVRIAVGDGTFRECGGECAPGGPGVSGVRGGSDEISYEEMMEFPMKK